MRTTTFGSALAISSLMLASAALAADTRSGERHVASSPGRTTAVSRATASAPRASAPVVRASMPAVRSSVPLRSPAAPPARLASDQSPRTAPAGSEPIGSAVSRGGDSGGGSWGGSSGGSSTPSNPGTETIQSSGGDRRSGSSGRGNAVSRGGRSRGDRSAIGTAEGRTHPPFGGGGGGGGYWDPGYWWNNPAYYYGYSGFGLGYFYYDPMWWGAGWGGGDPYGYGVYGGGGGGGYESSVRRDAIGQLRLKIKPKDAQVFVDGALAGNVGDFDGTFERLDLPQGRYHVEVRLQGHKPLTYDVNIQADELTTLRGKFEN